MDPAGPRPSGFAPPSVLTPPAASPSVLTPPATPPSGPGSRWAATWLDRGHRRRAPGNPIGARTDHHGIGARAVRRAPARQRNGRRGILRSGQPGGADQRADPVLADRSGAAGSIDHRGNARDGARTGPANAPRAGDRAWRVDPAHGGRRGHPRLQHAARPGRRRRRHPVPHRHRRGGQRGGLRRCRGRHRQHGAHRPVRVAGRRRPDRRARRGRSLRRACLSLPAGGRTALGRRRRHPRCHCRARSGGRRSAVAPRRRCRRRRAGRAAVGRVRRRGGHRRHRRGRPIAAARRPATAARAPPRRDCSRPARPC